MSKPTYASEVPYVPVNWFDRDNMTGRILEILEAVMPEGKQLTATKNLVKESTKRYFINLFNDQFDDLTTGPNIGFSKSAYSEAIWEMAQKQGLPADQIANAGSELN